MAQSQLDIPGRSARRTPSRDAALNIELDYNELSDNASQGNNNAIQGSSNATRGNRKASQGNQNSNAHYLSEGEICESDPDRAPCSWQKERQRAPVSQGRTSGKRKRGDCDDFTDDEGNSDSLLSSAESEKESETEDDMFDPSEILKKGVKVPAKVTRYIEKYATQGITKTQRQEITKNCNVPNSKKFSSKQTDRFMKKLFKRKFKQPLSQGKERSIINAQNRILDATGPLAILWSEAEKIKKKQCGLNPVDVINLVQRALVLIGNAHYVYMTDRRKSLLGRVLPDCVDLIDDRDGKKALCKASGELFGRNFRRTLSSESKDNKELFNLLSSFPPSSKYKNKNRFHKRFGSNFSSAQSTSTSQNHSFRLEPPNSQFQFGGSISSGRGNGTGRGNLRRGQSQKRQI